MKLKYVGAMPIVSNKGVGFDETKPDRYTFLNAAVELLEALNYGPSEITRHLYNVSGKEYSADELKELLEKHCPNLDDYVESSEQKAKSLVEELIKRVHENSIITEDDRNAWLKNIDLMEEYYYQYVRNESAYKCALEALGQHIHDAQVQEVTFPMFRNYGLVLHDLDYVMQHRKPPIDSNLTVEAGRDGLMGRLTITHR